MTALERISRLFRSKRADSESYGRGGRRVRATVAEVERLTEGRDKMCHLFSDPCGQDKHVTSLKVDPMVGKLEYKPGPPASQNW